ncbi:hypothetical protein E3N88_25553 [Mikania micrantha]|uniref:Integrase catalytic domain-containing protein n=1 Tax=Mikania micrantha TaxID=192012 RepID=A0A5N6N523_9ASTR|nr:hypothetical protein E3N88_25553 [Mikania micrantha]
MDLFGPVNVMSIGKKSHCLVITDDYFIFTWFLFIAKKDETAEILKKFITLIENQKNLKVNVIRTDNGTEFRNQTLIYFCDEIGIARQCSAARTPQQNGVAERQNRLLIEAARTMLSESKLPIFFLAEVVNTSCYVQNHAILNKPPYEIFFNQKPKAGRTEELKGRTQPVEIAKSRSGEIVTLTEEEHRYVCIIPKLKKLGTTDAQVVKRAKHKSSIKDPSVRGY